MIGVVASCYLLGVSTRRMDRLVQTLGSRACRSRRSRGWLRTSTGQVAAFRTLPLGDAGPFTFVAADALTMKVREG